MSLSIFFSVIAAYAAYILGEEAHVSGVLAVVAAAIFGGWNAHKAIDAGTRLSAIAFWGVMTFGLEALLFVLLGLQAPLVADEVDVGSLALQALAVAGVVIAVRMLMTVGLGRVIADTLRERVAIGWAGMRGAISLAAALAVDTSVEERSEILLLTFGVILITLLGQGLTLPPLLRVLKLPTASRWAPDEALARLEAAQAALDRLDELEEEGASSEPLRRLRELYRGRFAICVAVLGGGELPDEQPRGAARLRRDAARRDRRGARVAADAAQRGQGQPGDRAARRARPRPRRGADPLVRGSVSAR